MKATLNKRLSYKNVFKFLFHGTMTTEPSIVYNSEDGLDFRFSRAGLFGQGVYFA